MFQQTFKIEDEGNTRIVFISDLHIGLSGFRDDIFDEILKELKKPNTYWIGIGDYVEGRNPKAKYFDYDENTMSVQDQYDYFFAKIAPFKDRCLGLHVGNHERGLIRESTIDPLKSYCLLNKIPYMGGTAITTLKKGKKTHRVCTLHGAGGGAKVGSNLNKLNDYLMNFEADTIVCGHYHKLAESYGMKPYMDDTGKHRWRYTRVVLNGSCLDAYSNKGSSYAEVGMMAPNALGFAVLVLDEDMNADVELKPFV